MNLKILGIPVFILLLLTVGIFTFQTIGEDSCLSGESLIGSDICIVGGNAELTNTMEGETSQEQLYGQSQIIQNDTVIQKSNWSTIQTTSTNSSLSQLNEINFNNFNNIQESTAIFDIQDTGNRLVAQNIDTNCNCWFSTDHLPTVEKGEAFEYHYDMKINNANTYSRVSHGLYPNSISDSSQTAIGWGITYQGGEEGYFRTLNNSQVTTPYNYNEWYSVHVSRNSGSNSVDFSWEDSNGNTVDTFTIQGDADISLENFKMVGGRNLDFINEGDWDAEYRNLIFASESSVYQYTYSNNFKEKFDETGNYEYRMTVAEEEDGQIVDEFSYPFEVVEASEPETPTDSLTDYFLGIVDNIVESLSNIFEEGELLTPNL